MHRATNARFLGMPCSAVYSILFFPSSALRYLAVLSPLSCRATSGPMTLFFLTLLIVSLYPSVAHGRGFSFGQLTYFPSVSNLFLR